MLYNGPGSQEASRPNSSFGHLQAPSHQQDLQTMAPPPNKGHPIYANSPMPRNDMGNPAGLQYPPPDDPSPNQEINGHDLQEFLRNVMGDETMAGISHADGGPGGAGGTWTPRNLFEFGMDTNLELNDIDLSFLDDYNQTNPFNMTTPTADNAPSVKGSVTSEPSEPPLGVESLAKSSTWRFHPVSKDTRENAISLPTSDSLKRLTVDRRATPEALSHGTRDQLLTIIITSGPEFRSIKSFPSVELLDSLLQYYLTTTAAPTSLIHAASFRPSQKRPELCASMIAAGATMCPDAALRKLGFAIQETVHLAVPKLLEKDNTMTRDLQCVQASVIALGVGLWSGNSRKMEMAESFLQPWATMIRRSVSLPRTWAIMITTTTIRLLTMRRDGSVASTSILFRYLKTKDRSSKTNGSSG